MNHIKLITITLFLLLFSCDRIKPQTSDDINNDLEIERNLINFEFRGFGWNTLKEEIIKKEGIPKDRFDGTIFYGNIENTRRTGITYFNKIILYTINANKLEYEFIDNKLMRARYVINLANSDEIERNFDNDKNNDFHYLQKDEAIELFDLLCTKLNEKYIQLEADAFSAYINKNVLRFGAKETEIEISLHPLSRDIDTFWISIDYEYTNYRILKKQLYDDDKLRFESVSSGL